MPRDWKLSGGVVLCGQCWRRRFGLRSITMAVVEPIRATWQELLAELERSCHHETRHERDWSATFTDGRPVVRVLSGDRWWEMRLKSPRRGGQRAAYERIATGGVHGELFFFRAPSGNGQRLTGLSADTGTLSRMMCRIVAWLPRQRAVVEAHNGLPEEANQPFPGVPDLEKADLRNLRSAIRAGWVSFPSQVPTFTNHRVADLEAKLVQLYFILGWNTRNIGARYGLHSTRIRQILDTWKRRAVKAGYLQYIASAEAKPL